LVNIGLIGCGRVANLHLGAYRSIPEAKVVAVSDINLEAAKAFAQRYSIEKTFQDYSSILELKNLDLVDICTPTLTHATIASEAARSGHNILLEKPMARTTSDCDKIIHEISTNKVKLCICHNQIFIPQVMQAKAIVDSADFDLTSFRVSVKESASLIGAPNWVVTPEQGGVIWETGCHPAYLQLHFLKDITDIHAIGKKTKHSVYDNYVALLNTPKQTIGVIDVSFLAKRSEILFEFMGSNGRRMQISDYTNFLQIPERAPKGLVKGFYADQKAVIKKWVKIGRGALGKGKLLKFLPHFNLITRYIQSLKDDSNPPVTPEDGRRTIELLECIEGALDTNKPTQMRSE
jgi:predicted dehydrogenase